MGDFRATVDCFASIAVDSACVCVQVVALKLDQALREVRHVLSIPRQLRSLFLRVVETCVDSGLVCFCVRTCVYV